MVEPMPVKHVVRGSNPRSSAILRLPSDSIGIHIELFKYSILVSWNEDPNVLLKFLKDRQIRTSAHWNKEFLELTESTDGICTGFEGASSILIWFPIKPSYRTIGHVIHEVVHAVDLIFEARRIGDERETRAYLTTHILMEILKGVKTC